MHVKQASRVAALLAAWLFAALLPGLPAHAQDADTVQTRSKRVGVGDLDLTRAADRAVLAHRIELAAREVCGLYDGDGGAFSSTYRTCHDDAVEDAAAQTDLLVAATRTKGKILADGQFSRP